MRWLVFLLLSMWCLCNAQRKRTVANNCTSGLFVTRQEVEQWRTGQTLSFDAVGRMRETQSAKGALYSLEDYRKLAVFDEKCTTTTQRDATTGAMSIHLVDCRASNYRSLMQRRSTTCHQCCRTVSSVSVAQTVTDLYTGEVHQAKHFASSYQLLNLGHCVSPGAACGYQGTCMQAIRVEWVLVSLPSGDKFVPTTVPSHCTCIY